MVQYSAAGMMHRSGASFCSSYRHVCGLGGSVIRCSWGAEICSKSVGEHGAMPDLLVAAGQCPGAGEVVYTLYKGTRIKVGTGIQEGG
eukprot:1145629-Pelagomonas_calceolata.AAC.1